jgi:chromosome partitioning protein
MATIITIANQKGGVAKTTTTRHLAYFLEELAVKTLVIDNDHQANLTQYFGLDPIKCEQESGSMTQVILREEPLGNVLRQHGEHLHIAPSSISLAEAGARLLGQIDNNGILKQQLQPVRNDFQVILIDCGPNLERLLINALVASNYVLIPTKTDSLSISGIPALLQTVQQVRASMNPALQILGVLPTIYHPHNLADNSALAALRSGGTQQGVRIFEPIPSATNYDKAAGMRKSVFELYPDTPGRAEYEELAKLIATL